MVILKWTLIVVVAGYFGAIVLLYFTQRALMYVPDRFRIPAAAAGLPQAEDVVFETRDGERLVAWYVRPRGDRPVVLYFHGNGGALSGRAERFRVLTADGLGLLAVDYRGYGGSTGSPTEAGLLIDADAAYAFATARYPAARIVLWGESLGSGVAVALAARQPVGRVVLEAPYTSTADIAAELYRFAPVRLLMKDQFHSDARIAAVKAPLLVLHGTDDTVVPIRFGERLFALAPEPKHFARFAGGGHENLDQFGALEVAKRFIDGEMD
jgi:fermentation-respiration switch protein FrsA (DUF1100 family)